MGFENERDLKFRPGPIFGPSDLATYDRSLLQYHYEVNNRELEERRLSSRTNRVSDEVMDLLKNAILPTAKTACFLQDSLWKRPLILVSSHNLVKLLKTEEYYKRVAKEAQLAKPKTRVVTLTIE